MSAVPLLAGMRVIEASAFVAAPWAGLTLAQWGADVIRVDPLQGALDRHRWPLTQSGESLYWAGLNKGKRSVALDLRSGEGKALLASLITAPGADAGIFITNLSAGVPSYEELVKVRADVIVIHIVGNSDGTPAVDYTVNCAAGFPGVTGPASLTEPVNHVLPAWDVICGSNAAMAVLAAERHRRATGQGQYVRIALSDVAMTTAGHLGFLAEAQINAVDRERHGNALYGSFGRDFVTLDGERVMIVAVTARQWKSIVAAMNLTEAVSAIETAQGLDFSREADRWAARAALFDCVGGWTSRHKFTEVRSALDQHDVLWGPYQSFRQLLSNDPRCSTANPVFTEIDQPGIGRHLAPGSPVAFSASARVPAQPAPSHGQHTHSVLTEILGLDREKLRALSTRGVIHA